MLIYKDIVSKKGDELISDAYVMKEVEDGEGVQGGLFYEVECRMVTVRKGADVDIGANASAEDAPQDFGGDETETVIDAIHAFRLTPCVTVLAGNKKSYHGHLKAYFSKLKEKLNDTGAPPEEYTSFMTKVQNSMDYINLLAKGELYVGENVNDDNGIGMVVPLRWKENETIPYLTFWKHGLKAEKY